MTYLALYLYLCGAACLADCYSVCGHWGRCIGIVAEREPRQIDKKNARRLNLFLGYNPRSA